ncbi:MAG: HEAT repeat domain-containing protein [Planctomycetes bacterium]|nr:HEAT repeat domain-containing protein [Planctomycetota bacterium]
MLRDRTNARRAFRWLRCAVLAIAWIMAVEPWKAAWLPGPSGAQAFARKAAPPPVRFAFKMDPKTPDRDLLPVPPTAEPSIAPWLIKDLAQVPQILFQKPLAVPAGTLQKLDGKILMGGQEVSFADLGEHGQKMAHQMVPTAKGIARINHLNKKGTDHFMKVLVKSRPDLAGLPFMMGDACRMDKKQSAQFVKEVARVRGMLQEPFAGLTQKQSFEPEFMPLRIATWMQMLASEPSAMQKRLVRFVAASDRDEATRSLARLAVFSFESEVRDSAVKELADRSGEESDDILLQGLRYPWPDVARFAADAIVKLQRKDLVPRLVGFLDEPDPRAPVARQVDGKEVFQVRELVRINHHQNCLLCHAPGNTPDIKMDAFARTAEVVTGAVPIIGQPLPPPSQGYDPSSSPDIRIRADITYLRQDFSLLQPVANAAPWPDKQRFDFLVRTRDITPQEAAAYTQWRYGRGPADLSPNHRAVLDALRTLTGRDAAPTARAWRVALAKGTPR